MGLFQDSAESDRNTLMRELATRNLDMERAIVRGRQIMQSVQTFSGKRARSVTTKPSRSKNGTARVSAKTVGMPRARARATRSRTSSPPMP